MTIEEVVVLKEAVRDLGDGKAFYDGREKAVGDYFFDSLCADMQSLVVYGGIHRRHLGMYRMLARRFPYAVYYELADGVAYVVAVLPMRRDPAWIKGRLEEREP